MSSVGPPPPDTFERFGELLRYLRRRARLTQRDLSIAVGYSESQISRMEQGHRPPDAATLRARFLPALGLDGEPGLAERLLNLAAAARVAPQVEAAPLPVPAPVGLLATKLFRPRPHPDLVSRPRLVAALDAAPRVPLTLVVAPAGFGKTTLVASWLQQWSAAAPDATSSSYAWLALDADDNDPATFLRYLVAALQRLAPGVGITTLALIGAAPLPRATLLTPLINDLAGLPDDCVLVLDDYHLLTRPEIHELVGFLLEHLPPRLHLVIASREDPPLPLARMRARRQLVELRATDLRFSLEEAGQFLRGLMQLPVTLDELAALEAHTEGWVAGLQLVALALKDRPDTSLLIAGLTSGSHYIIDYLGAEVLERLPAHLRSFLVQSAVLDRMCGPLCDTVLGLEAPAPGQSPTAYSQLILQELERRHLFVVPLDAERRWYRYHHLFGAFLRTRLHDGAAESQVTALHRRASAWFEQHGLLDEAIQHALAGADLEHAAQLIGQAGLRVAGYGRVQTVLGWLHALPESGVQTRPALCFLYAVLLLNTNQVSAAAAWLDLAERGLETLPTREGRDALRGQVLVVRASEARLRGDVGRSAAEAARALALLEGAPLMFRAVAMLNVAFGFLATGDVTAASEERLRQALVVAEGADNPAAQLGGLVTLGLLQTVQGRRRQAGATYARLLRLLESSEHLRTGAVAAVAYLYQGEWLREQNRLDEAERQLALGMALVRDTASVDAHMVLAGALAQARLRLALADIAGASTVLEHCERLLRERAAAPYLLDQLAAAGALVALTAGDRAAAMRWAATVVPELDGETLFLREPEYLILARVWLAEARGGGADEPRGRALGLLGRLLADAEAKERHDSVVRIRTLEALALQSGGETDRALATLAPALAAAPEGYVRVFVDEGAPMAALLRAALARGLEPAYTTRLLALVSSTPAEPAPAGQGELPEVLTAREREILRLIAGGASNQGVADALILSVGTVKKHVNNILGKLDVHSRTQAIARARELGLL